MNASADTHVLTDGLMITAENPLGSAVVSRLLTAWPDALGLYAFGSRAQAGAARPDTWLGAGTVAVGALMRRWVRKQSGLVLVFLAARVAAMYDAATEAGVMEVQRVG